MNTQAQTSKLQLAVMKSACPDFVAGQGVEVLVDERLRHLADRRTVWKASISGRGVVLKVFHAHAKQERDTMREWGNAVSLHELGLPVPSPLFMANETGGGLVVAYHFVPQSKTLAEVLMDADEGVRRECLRQLVQVHDTAHEAGVYQSDDHLGNYLWDGDRLWLLDTATCEISDGPLSVENRVSNMAMLVANVPLAMRGLFYGELFHAGSSWAEQGLREALEQALPAAVRRRLEKYARKTRRSCTEFERVDEPGRMWLACRDMDPELRLKMLDDPDQFLKEVELLKKGNTCTVGEFEHGGRTYVLKRYNKKSLGYRITHALMPVRALTSWTGGHVLRLFGVPTPRPVACLVEKKYGLRVRSYLLMEKVCGEPLLRMDRAKLVDPAHGIPEKFASRWRELEWLLATHGDLKASNLIFADEGDLQFIDLDSIRFHQLPRSFRSEQTKDLARFMRNWQDHPEVQQAFKDALKDA